MRWVGMAGLLFGGACLLGCTSTGHREITFTLFGSTFSWEDKTYVNEQGKTEWTSDVIAGSSLTEWAFGNKEPEVNGSAQPGRSEDSLPSNDGGG